MIFLRRVTTTLIRWRVRGEVKTQIELLRAELTQASAEHIAALSLRLLELETQVSDLRQAIHERRVT